MKYIDSEFRKEIKSNKKTSFQFIIYNDSIAVLVKNIRMSVLL